MPALGLGVNLHAAAEVCDLVFEAIGFLVWLPFFDLVGLFLVGFFVGLFFVGLFLDAFFFFVVFFFLAGRFFAGLAGLFLDVREPLLLRVSRCWRSAPSIVETAPLSTCITSL